MEINDYAICINKERYAFDIAKIKEICLVSDAEKSKEQEIVENWEIDPASQKPEIVSKINREMRTAGNPQNDTILYDMIKLFITSVLSNDITCGNDFRNFDFSTAISFNTLLKEGIIVKL